MIIQKLTIGAGALATAQMVNEVPTDGTAISEVVKIVVQLVVGVATLIGLFRKPKKDC